MTPPRLVLATANPGKVAELRALVGEWGAVAVASLSDFPGVTLPAEGATSYVDNALAKARTLAAVTGLPALGDDSGLEVDALQGGPGVRSARLAPTDEERIGLLLAALDGVADRRARFRCVVVLVWPDGRTECAEGVCTGRIAQRAEGCGGFGYDPVFVADELGCTFAAASAAEKARTSHRARAMRVLGARLTGSSDVTEASPALRRPGGP